jgi:hypothetical protein
MSERQGAERVDDLVVAVVADADIRLVWILGVVEDAPRCCAVSVSTGSSRVSHGSSAGLPRA